jgi:hypothetical protein
MRTFHRFFVCLALIACASAQRQQAAAEAQPREAPVAPKQPRFLQR